MQLGWGLGERAAVVAPLLTFFPGWFFFFPPGPAPRVFFGA